MKWNVVKLISHRHQFLLCISSFKSRLNTLSCQPVGPASASPKVRPQVRPSYFCKCAWFSHYCSCPTVRVFGLVFCVRQHEIPCFDFFKQKKIGNLRCSPFCIVLLYWDLFCHHILPLPNSAPTQHKCRTDVRKLSPLFYRVSVLNSPALGLAA